MDPTTPHDPQPDTAPLPASTPPTPPPAAPPVWATPAAPPPIAPPDPALASGTTGWGPAPVMPGPVTGVKPKGPRRRDPLSIVLVIAAFVALGGVGFAAGRVTAPAAAAPNARGAFPGNGGAFAFPSGGLGGGNGGGLTRGLGGNVAIRGTVTAITDTEVTITVTGGGTVNIPISGTTTYHNETAGSASDVKTGSTVLVQLGQGAGGPNASPGASPDGGGRTLGTAQDITIVAQ